MHGHSHGLMGECDRLPPQALPPGGGILPARKLTCGRASIPGSRSRSTHRAREPRFAAGCRLGLLPSVLAAKPGQRLAGSHWAASLLVVGARRGRLPSGRPSWRSSGCRTARTGARATGRLAPPTGLGHVSAELRRVGRAGLAHGGATCPRGSGVLEWGSTYPVLRSGRSNARVERPPTSVARREPQASDARLRPSARTR